MGKPHPDKRTRLIETAMKLAYSGRGFREASLADIAQVARVPLGNVYYYFKTKEVLGEAVVDRCWVQFREFLDQWDRLSSPKERLFAFVDNIRSNKDQLVLGGCPLGGLCLELHKEGGALARKSACPLHRAHGVAGEAVPGGRAWRRIHENLRFMSSLGSSGSGSGRV